MAGGCATALMLPALLVTAVPSAAAPATPPVTFIEALAAVPDATRALAAARQEFQTATARRATFQSAADAALAALDEATSIRREAQAARVRADLAAARSQATVDGIARTMYASGGTEPSLVDVLLTADTELGFARSLVMRQYLASAGERVVEVDDLADETRPWAIGRLASASASRAAAALAVVAADTALAEAANETAVRRAEVDEARADYRMLLRLTTIDRSADYGRLRSCGDWLTRLLSRSGFAGEDLREAWAIVMRESGGTADAVSDTGDLRLFQINTATWKDQDWFDRKLLLTRKYNSQVAFELSRGGRTWYSWGLDGHGRPDAGAYVKTGWSDERISSHIVVPYIQWYAQYPCRPAYERAVALPVPELPFNSYGQQPGVDPKSATP